MKPALPPFAALAAALVAVAPARADVVSPPPTNCPGGTDPETCHGPPYCAPHLCVADADCKGAGVCKSASFCVSSIHCSGGWGGPHPPVQSVSGVCSGTCADGATCSTLKVCMSSTPTRPAPSSPSAASSSGAKASGGSCNVAGSPGGEGAWLAALAAAAAALRRRRTR